MQHISLLPLLCLILFFNNFIMAVSYIYPVAIDTSTNTLLVIYQTGNKPVLYRWSPQTKIAQKLLWSVYTPVDIKMLPSNTDFSFIHDGHICVKNFTKRSARSIEFFEQSLYDIEEVHWIDDQRCYFHAKHGGQCNIYQANTAGDVISLVSEKDMDCKYPTVIGQELFFMGRTREAGRFTTYLYKQEYGNNNYARARKRLMLVKDPILHFKMISSHEGFYVTHTSEIGHNVTFITCYFHRISFNGRRWHDALLFSFNLPCELLFGQKRLFESFPPLLPRQIGKNIYFSSLLNENLALYSYNSTSGKICLESKLEGHIFPPLENSGELWYGGQEDIEYGIGFVGDTSFLRKL